MKQKQKPARRTPILSVQEFAAVRGGENGVIHLDAIVGGGSPRDNGVIHMQ